MKKRVLFVPSWFPDDADPISGVFIQEQALALTREFDVAVLIPGMAAWRNVMNRNARDTSRTEHHAGLRVHREFARPLVPHGPEWIVYLTFARAARMGFKKLLRTWGRPDVIHAHVVLPAGWAAMQVARQYGIPIVLTEHSSPFSMHLGTALSRRLARDTVQNVHRLIAISPALASQLRDFQPNLRIDVIGESVRTDFFVPSNGARRAATGTTRFFVAARLAEQKGLSYLIEASQSLVKRGVTSFELTIGGDGPDRSKLEQLARTLGVADRCRFLGALDRDQVRTNMQHCDVFVLSSLHETFGVVVGEAMACGKPVISTRCGGPEFIVDKDSGVLVDVADASGLADAMAEFVLGRLSFDPTVVRNSIVRRFGPEAFVRNVAAVYGQLR